MQTVKQFVDNRFTPEVVRYMKQLVGSIMLTFSERTLFRQLGRSVFGM